MTTAFTRDYAFSASRECTNRFGSVASPKNQCTVYSIFHVGWVSGWVAFSGSHDHVRQGPDFATPVQPLVMEYYPCMLGVGYMLY